MAINLIFQSDKFKFFIGKIFKLFDEKVLLICHYVTDTDSLMYQLLFLKSQGAVRLKSCPT